MGIVVGPRGGRVGFDLRELVEEGGHIRAVVTAFGLIFDIVFDCGVVSYNLI